MDGGRKYIASWRQLVYQRRMIGVVDDLTIAKARTKSINIAGGCINKKDGRVRLFVKGKFPGAHPSGGYALRSRVVWWLNTGEVLIGTEVNVHHKNHNRADDSFDNLEKMDHVKHAHAHNPKTVEMVERTCKTCGNSFTIEKWRLLDKARGQFCSQKCYQSRTRKNVRIAVICEECSKPYEVIPSRIGKTKFCSYE